MKHLEVAIAIIPSPQGILICQRPKGGTFPDFWEFPGGKIEPGETPEACLIREIHEELGIDIAPIEPFPPIEHTYGNVSVNLHPFFCDHLFGTPQPLASQRLVWATPSRLTEYAFPAANATLIPLILRRLKTR